MSGRLTGATSWWYQLQGDFNERERDEDVIVTDIDAPVPDTHDFLGNRRQRLAYLSVGEAEDYREYWDAIRKVKGVVIRENPEWKGNYAVKFWRPEWQEIIRQRVLFAKDQGFDGVYLDKCDVVNDLTEYDAQQYELLKQGMVLLVQGIRDCAGENFDIVMQNAEFLLDDPRLVEAIDGLGIEDLFYGATVTGRQNGAADIVYRLKLIHASKLPVLCVEYLDDPEDQLIAKHDIKSEGFVPLIRPEDRELS